jgi:phosphoenolpyruvate carboxykinase (ATP)
VPNELMDPRNSWKDKNAYDEKAKNLAEQFIKNFSQYASAANEEILAAAPKVEVTA